MLHPNVPLQGTRVLDLSWVFTGPLCTRILAALGAEVIKVESRKRPDLSSREWVFPYLNTQKKSCTIDLSTARGKELAHELVKRSDIVIENFSTGVMERLGLGYATLRELRSDLIIVSSSPVGRTGPSRGDPAYGSMIQCLTGWGALSSYPGSPPTEFGGVWADPLSGTTLAFIVLAALYQREATGEGQFIDLSMAETIISGLPEALMAGVMFGHAPESIGNRDPVMAPHGCYPCRGQDSWVSIAVASDEEWQSLCDVMGRADMATDPRFADGLSRWERQDEIDSILASWTRERYAYDVMHRLQAVGIAAGPVLTSPELVADSHLNARGLFARIKGDPDGRFTIGLPWTIDGQAIDELDPCPEVGEHNQEVFADLLGLSQGTIAALVDEKVIY